MRLPIGLGVSMGVLEGAGVIVLAVLVGVAVLLGVGEGVEAGAVV